MELDLIGSGSPARRARLAAAVSAPPLVEASGLGVTFSSEGKRDDVQSLAYRLLSRAARRPPFRALEDVSFTASAGEIVGVIGANGSGKTTLCRALAGLLRPDAGTLAVRGETSALLSLGTGFDAELSGRENIIVNGLMLGLSARAIRALLPAIVDFSGIGRFIDEPLKHYSAGMKSRLGFSIATMIEPEILLLDETLSTGDLEFTARAGERLQALMRQATLVIVVSHQLEFIAEYCTKALWLDRGRLRAAGEPDDVVARYRASLPERRQVTQAALGEGTKAAARPHQALTARGVGVRYALHPTVSGRRAPDGQRSFWALEDVAFTLSEGEILGIIGPNGAGKTTLCKVLTGIIRPDRGHVSVAGDVTALLTLGAGFNHQLTGRDNVYLNAMFLGIPKQRVHEVYPDIVTFSGIEPFIDEPVKHYSRGMRSRLAFSIAATLEPDVLIIDEALNAGDEAFADKARTKIDQLIQRARAVIVVTHNLTFVTAVCTRAIWLRRGRIELDGSPEDAVHAYRASLRPPAPPTTDRPVAADA